MANPFRHEIEAVQQAAHHIGSTASHGASSYLDWVHNPGGKPRPLMTSIGSLIPTPPTSTSSHHSHGTTKPTTKPPKLTKPLGGTRAPAGSRNGSQATVGTSNAPSRTVRRPLTFTDSRGTVHRVRRTSTSTATAGQAKPAKDPLEALVDEMLAGQALPLENDKKALVEQSAGNVNQLNRLHDFYGNQVEGIRTGANADFGAMLQRAAELKGISADTIAKNQEWLRSLAGPSNGGTLDAQAGQSGAETLANVAGANDSLARDISARGTSLNDTMAQLEVAGRAAQRDAVQQEMLAQQAGVREADRNIAELRAQKPAMLAEMRDKALQRQMEQAVVEAKTGMDMAKFQSLDNYRQGQLALQAERLKQDSKEEPGRYGNLPKRWNETIDQVLANLEKQASSPHGIQRPWTQAFEQLGDRGLAPFAAASLATRWYGDYAREHSNPVSFMRLLGQLNAGQQRHIIDSIWGRGTFKTLPALAAQQGVRNVAQTGVNISQNLGSIL